MNDHFWLWLALVAYATSVVLTWRRLRGGGAETALHRANVTLMVTGFALQTVFLILRGEALRRCPLTNLFEVQVFFTWAAVLFYLVIGPAYRLSFLGAFTAPVVVVICLTALLLPVDLPGAEPIKRSPWVEFHAAIGILAWGAFALTAVLGGMYLAQERLLKQRKAAPALFLLPSLDQLEVVALRLLILGTAIYTVGMVGGIVSSTQIGHWGVVKTFWATVIWVVYLALVMVRLTSLWRGRRFAVGVLAAFIFTMVAFWGVSWPVQ